MVRKASDSLREILAENIKTFRKAKGLSQEELADRCGLHRTYIGSIERRERNVTLSSLEVLSRTLVVSVPDLLSTRRREHGGGDEEISDLMDALCGLTPSQRRSVRAILHAFEAPRRFWRAPDSDLISEAVLDSLGDRLVSHHATSRQPLSKDRFEFALESALNGAGVSAQLVRSRTNRGHDITIEGAPVSLKTEAAANISEEKIHVSKWMELGKSAWELPRLLKSFLEHLESYDQVFTLRCLSSALEETRYELVEIPKALLLEAAGCVLEVREESRQNPKPGYGYVNDAEGNLKFALYFDGGTERKLQLKGVRKELCKVHATWSFGSTPLE